MTEAQSVSVGASGGLEWLRQAAHLLRMNGMAATTTTLAVVALSLAAGALTEGVVALAGPAMYQILETIATGLCLPVLALALVLIHAQRDSAPGKVKMSQILARAKQQDLALIMTIAAALTIAAAVFVLFSPTPQATTDAPAGAMGAALNAMSIATSVGLNVVLINAAVGTFWVVAILNRARGAHTVSGVCEAWMNNVLAIIVAGGVTLGAYAGATLMMIALLPEIIAFALMSAAAGLFCFFAACLGHVSYDAIFPAAIDGRFEAEPGAHGTNEPGA